MSRHESHEHLCIQSANVAVLPDLDGGSGALLERACGAAARAYKADVRA